MNIKSCLQATLFSFLLVSMSVYADNNQASNSQKSGGQTTSSQQGEEHDGNGSGKGNIKSMHTSNKGMKGDNGYHHKHDNGWHKRDGYHDVGYYKSFHEGKYCKKIKGHYNRFGEWIPKHKICYEYEYDD